MTSSRDIVLVRLGFNDPTVITHINDNYDENKRTVQEIELERMTLRDLAAYLNANHPRPAAIMLEPGTPHAYLNDLRAWANNSNITIGTRGDFRNENH